MGFLSDLGNVIGGFFGDPGLGDQLGSLFGGGSNTANNLSNTLGGAASGMANQQNQQAMLAGARSNAAQTQYNNALNQALLQKMLAPQQGAQMAAKGDLQANVQDVTPVFTPGAGYSFTGGLRPSALGPNARQAGRNLSNAGLAWQGAPGLPQQPDLLSSFPQSTPSGLQQALQYGALGTGILGSFGQSPLQQILAQLQKQGAQQNPNPTASGGGGGGDWGDN